LCFNSALTQEESMRLYRTQGREAKQAAAALDALTQRGGSALDSVLPAVRKIVREVRERGDVALLKYAAKFDGLLESTSAAPAALLVTQEETAAAWEQIDPSLKLALEKAACNIRAFANRQMPQSWQESPPQPQVGALVTGQLVRPLDSVGCYVPGGRHPLPSTMLMTVIPAQVAGVSRIVVTSPRPAAETLATAHLLGVTEFYRIGGAHAISALAYGTEAIPRVAKIVGPGNLYVTAAKRMVAFDCAIDMLAGPTEIVVTSDKGNPESIAADLVAQAEHDPEALAIFVTTKEALGREVMAAAKHRSRKNPVASAALDRNGYVFVAGSKSEAQAITNRLAPEHLTVDSDADLEWVQNAGSVFLGKHSPQPMGDYISGPNHTLPTGGMAKVRGGLSVMDFVKLITVQQYDAAALAELGPHAIRIAEAEGLVGHAEAIRSSMKAGGTRE
jgi:histidinol dehydrogenase